MAGRVQGRVAFLTVTGLEMRVDAGSTIRS
ncbi:MAG: hypothetical protein JWM19_5733 [Actinomycetia bacterium]|nr:hypothetical protein [Actinomycetes bacterium]